MNVHRICRLSQKVLLFILILHAKLFSRKLVNINYKATLLRENEPGIVIDRTDIFDNLRQGYEVLENRVPLKNAKMFPFHEVMAKIIAFKSAKYFLREFKRTHGDDTNPNCILLVIDDDQKAAEAILTLSHYMPYKPVFFLVAKIPQETQDD